MAQLSHDFFVPHVRVPPLDVNVGNANTQELWFEFPNPRSPAREAGQFHPRDYDVFFFPAMIRVITLMLIGFAPGFALAQYSLTIVAPAGASVVGSPIKIWVALENVSKKNLTIVKDRAAEWGENTYEVGVVSATGAPVELTPYGRALNHLYTFPPIVIRGSPNAFTLKPHEKVVDTILLSKIYRFTPGTYIVRVRKKTVTDTPEPDIVSNTLSFTILSK